jgi:16S rRNA C967 or C1407 C5-methylase (RsmB/RsmF family)
MKEYTVKATMRIKVYDDTYDLTAVEKIVDDALIDASCSTPGFVYFDYTVAVSEVPHWLDKNRGNNP